KYYQNWFRGENDDIYCVFWDTMEDEEQQQKSLSVYSVLRVAVDATGTLSSNILIENKTIAGHWFQPCIADDALYFLVDDERPTNRYEILKISLNQEQQIEIISLSPTPTAFCPRFSEWAPQTCYIDGHILFYNFNKARRNGILFALNISGKVWK